MMRVRHSLLRAQRGVLVVGVVRVGLEASWLRQGGWLEERKMKVKVKEERRKRKEEGGKKEERKERGASR